MLQKISTLIVTILTVMSMSVESFGQIRPGPRPDPGPRPPSPSPRPPPYRPEPRPPSPQPRPPAPRPEPRPPRPEPRPPVPRPEPRPPRPEPRPPVPRPEPRPPYPRPEPRPPYPYPQPYPPQPYPPYPSPIHEEIVINTDISLGDHESVRLNDLVDFGYYPGYRLRTIDVWFEADSTMELSWVIDGRIYKTAVVRPGNHLVRFTTSGSVRLSRDIRLMGRGYGYVYLRQIRLGLIEY